MQQERVPPLPARLGLACYRCFKEEDFRLSRCSGCHRISYCSAGASLDWKIHKPMCKALSAIEKSNLVAAATLFFSLPSEPTTDFKRSSQYDRGPCLLISSVSARPTITERNLVGWEPRCMVCLFEWRPRRTEQRRRSPGISFPARRRYEGTSISRTLWRGAHDPSGQFMWAPERIQSAWTSLAGLSWVGEFGDEMRRSVGVPAQRPMAPWIRAASDNLTMAMTILYGLEKLNDDDAWTRKHTLTVHILGATAKEITGAMVFEEILHRLPEIKTLKLVLCGPEMPGGHIPRTIALDTCPECTRLGRKRIHEHVADTYHGFVQNKGTKFEKPDLCIAFNSGASQESTHTWPATFKFLVERKILSLFTAYNREEAEAEATLLRAAGATLHSALGPAKNPWGSIKMIPEPNKVYGFYAVNGWLAGGFK
ncbi:hypothetical protein B0H14DRAFT_2775756 [Mycena olivaceomarginata]|nr:hypothetical protein B0H14DRAFT_2775756 [Mycena olivaceomarginata]